MNPWINYHHLYYFKVIAESGSVSKAAEQLRLSQPTLSAQLKQFESTLGVRLFERNRKRLVLSDQGHVAFEYAQSIFKLGTEMYEALQDRLRPTKAHLQIGALDSIPKQILLKLSQFVYETGPCSVSLFEGNSDQLLRELAAHRLDFVVTNFIPINDESQSFYHKSIFKKQVDLYGLKKYATLKKKFPSSLNGQPFIMPTYDSKLRYDLEHWLRLRDISVDIIAETQDNVLKEMLSIQGLGLMPVSYFSVIENHKVNNMYKVGTLEGVNEEIFLVAAKRKKPNHLVQNIFQDFSL